MKNKKGLPYIKHFITTFKTPVKRLEGKVPESRIK